MNDRDAKTKADGAESLSTAGLGGGYAMPTNAVMTLTQPDSAIWATVSVDGVVTQFDNTTCRRLAAEFDPDAPIDQNKAIARLCAALLDKAAEEVDNILREGGGTSGDAIRGLTITTPNV